MFDAVRITFVNEQREEQFVQQRAKEQKVHGQDRVLLLPPREQFAEGRLYNILNQRVINAEKLAGMSEKDQRALNKIQKSAFETKMRAFGDETLAKETALCLNRYAHERNSQSYMHGFDPISNEAFEGRHAKATMPTRTHAALSAWQVLERGVPLSTKISPSQKPATASVLDPSHPAARESQSNYHQPTKQLSSSSDERQRPNILVVDHAPSTSAQQTPVPVRIAQVVLKQSGVACELLVFVSDPLWLCVLCLWIH